MQLHHSSLSRRQGHVYLECSYRSFKLHQENDSRHLFETIEKIEYILIQDFRCSLILPETGEWLLKEYDKDITIPESELQKKYPYIRHWYSKEGIKIKAIGKVFQACGKIMPICIKNLDLQRFT